MVRPVSEIPTEREAQVMAVLWELGRATAEQGREALPGRPHDSAVRTLLRALESKGYVAHDDRGKAYVYRAAVSQAKAQRTALTSLLGRLFGGSAEALLLRLVEDERVTPEQLEEIRKTIESPAERPARRPGAEP